MLPTNDENVLTYEQFKKVFGEDGNVIFIGFRDTALFNINHFNSFRATCHKIENIVVVV